MAQNPRLLYIKRYDLVEGNAGVVSAAVDVSRPHGEVERGHIPHSDPVPQPHGRRDLNVSTQLSIFSQRRKL